MLNEMLLHPRRTARGEGSMTATSRADDADGLAEVRAMKHVAAVWALRVLCRRPVLFRSQAGFADEERVLALTGLPESLIGERSATRVRRTVQRRLDALERETVPLTGPLFDNAAGLSSLLGLSAAETALLVLAVILQGDEALDSVFDALGNITRREMVLELANALACPAGEIQSALGRDGTLSGSGMLAMATHRSLRVRQELALLPGLADDLSTSAGPVERIFDRYFTSSPAPAFCPENFQHLEADWHAVVALLANTLATQRRGANVLLYGAPGVGKTELARTLGDALGANLFEIARNRDEHGADRMRAYRLAQAALASSGACLVVFDEVEDVFPETSHPLFGAVRTSGRDKAWTNELLETNPVPAVWLTNTVRPIDPAFLRRFDYVAEVKAPPPRVRERLLRERLRDLDPEAGWLRRMAACEHLVPSEIDRAARLVRLAANDDGSAAERVFERAVENMQHAMGLAWRRPRETTGNDELDYALVNSDVDLEAVTRGLARTGAGRIALYGPPGTGKSLYARHLADRLDKPLVQRHASNLLSMWVGGTEQNIAVMFEQAEGEAAVLLLDEADSFLQDRRGAGQQWEVSQVNELLTRLESFEGLFVCATNLFEHLDPAVLRRFDLKIRLDYLDAGQAWQLCRRTARALGIEDRPGAEREAARQALARLANLAPGDFAALRRRQRVLAQATSLAGLVEMLAAESRLKPDGVRIRPGFR